MATSATPRLLSIEDDGDPSRVVLPADLRERLGLTPQDQVWVLETDYGLLFMSRQAMLDHDRELVDAELRKQGLSLDELIESGREIRSDLLKELYGIEG
jgi:bifunctional DNA-binding transcriptional regulator/antitoxin component of YhaV-PrlF toxin-antitoxin module